MAIETLAAAPSLPRLYAKAVLTARGRGGQLPHTPATALVQLYSTGASAVIVVAGPNMTCPTSPLTCWCVFTYSMISRAADRQRPSGDIP
jgi:hypothetical protein